MKPQQLVLFCSLVFISSCCPSKSYFEKKFSGNTDMFSSIKSGITNIDTLISETNNELISVNESLDICCQSIEEGEFIGTIVNLAKYDRNAKTIGIIEELNSHLEYDEHSMPGFIYYYDSEYGSLKLGDTVEFRIKTSERLSFAFDIKKTLSKDIYVTGRTKTFPHINLHNRYYHPQKASHYKGHVIRVFSGFDEIINEIEYEKIEFKSVDDIIETLYAPKSFDPEACSEPDSIYITPITLPGINYKVILEMGCNHSELHH